MHLDAKEAHYTGWMDGFDKWMRRYPLPEKAPPR